eukprot:3939386-Rhodomonas_salina.4
MTKRPPIQCRRYGKDWIKVTLTPVHLRKDTWTDIEFTMASLVHGRNYNSVTLDVVRFVRHGNNAVFYLRDSEDAESPILASIANDGLQTHHLLFPISVDGSYHRLDLLFTIVPRRRAVRRVAHTSDDGPK